MSNKVIVKVNETPDAIVSTTPTITANMSNATYQGAPGHTPERGVDYWTDEDKAQIIEASIDEL